MPADAAPRERYIAATPAPVHERAGLLLGFVGVLCFSGSLPFTQVAVREFGVLFVSFGRAVVAGIIAVLVLLGTRTRVPPRRLWPQIGLAIAGVGIGFPAFVGLALQHAPAGHGSVVIGLLPAATAGLGAWRSGDRPSMRFWWFAALGAAAILVLTVARGSAELALGDLYLLAAVGASAVGYAEGAIASRELGGWQTISWVVVGALPITIPLAVIGLGPVSGHEPWSAWLGFAYLGTVSMYFGFFAWYAGLALGGVARVSQIQLVQPLLSLVWAGLFLHEQLDALIIAVALVVMVSVVGSRRSAVVRAPAQTISST